VLNFFEEFFWVGKFKKSFLRNLRSLKMFATKTLRRPKLKGPRKQIQVALVICGLFICHFAYMQLKNGLFSGTYPLIYGNLWSFYMRIHYMRAYFWSPYLSHITRSTCTVKPLYSEQPWDLKLMAVVDTWSLFRGSFVLLNWY